MERLELARRLGALPARVASGTGATIVSERDAARFQAAFSAAVAGAGPVFLADPAWGTAEHAALAALVAQGEAARSERGWLLIPSGGTSGQLKFARHDQDSIAAAVRGICAHFAVERMSSVGVLPLHHVSGLMAWMRAALTGGDYLPWDWKRLEAGRLVPVARSDATAAADGVGGGGRVAARV
jgi:O-succinylbenzoic acid--CoA ligase